MATIRSGRFTGRWAILSGALGAACLVGASGGCELIASVDPDLLNQGGGGGGSVTTGSTATTTTTGTSSTTGSTSSTTGGGEGGTGQGGGCQGPEDCVTVEECRVATCDDGACGETLADVGANCDNGGDPGFCEADGDCAACTETSQCGEASACHTVECTGGACVESEEPDGTACDGGVCDGGVCDVLQQCTNGQLDAGETDVDCGGPCPNCDNGDTCSVDDDCQSDVCDGTACRACLVDGDCNDDDYCEDAGANDGDCRPPLAGGAACDRAEECSSGFCPAEEEVCCDLACDGPCEACGGGTCTAYAEGSDPEFECAPSECLTGSCSGTSGCGTVAVGTSCGDSASCAADVATLQDTCDAVGACSNAGTVDCDPYICGGNSCLAVCDGDEDCQAGFICQAPSCVVDPSSSNSAVSSSSSG